MATKKSTAPSEEFCFGCESLLLRADEKHGPFCRGCFQKVKRKDPLTKAALQRELVAVVPMICPHEVERRHRCRTRFNVMVLDKNLEPVEITGPYTQRDADKRADKIRKRMSRRAE